MTIVEMVLSTSFCAVPAFMRVEPAITSGPTSTSIPRSARCMSSEPATQARPIVKEPAAFAWSIDPSVYGVAPLALTPRTTSFGPTAAASRSFPPTSWSSSAASSSLVTAMI